MRISFPDWVTLVERHLDRLGESAVLFTDERVNADAAYDDGELPLLFAKRLVSDRDYRAAKFSGELYR